MFITKKESDERLNDPENILNRLGIVVDSSPSARPGVLVPSEIPVSEFLEDPFLPDLSSLIDSNGEPEIDAKTLDKLLNPIPAGYAGRGTKGLHRDTQAGIGVTAAILGTTKAARLGDVAISQAQSYERGYTDPVTQYDPKKAPKEELQLRIVHGHGIVVDKCFNRLLKTLDLLDDDKLEKVQKASELSVVAKNLSGIIAHATQSTQDKTTDAREQNVHFHIMRPEQGHDADYPTLEINSEREERTWEEKQRTG